MTTAFDPWPEPRFIETNGIRMALFAAGPSGAKPPIVLCHGFPELAFSWRAQLKGLSERGFRVLAPDQRGYGLSDKPEAISAYTADTLCADLVGLLDAEGVERAVFCGHDWGGLVVWRMAQRHPDRVAGVIGVNTPHRRRLPVDPIEAMRAAFGEEMYIVFFQQEGAAEALFEADIDKTFRFFMRRSDMSPQQYAELPAERRNLALQKAPAHFTPTPEQDLLTPEERAVYVEAFQRGGFRGPINWYRNFTRNWIEGADLSDRIDKPCLMVMAEHDVVLPPSAADGMGELIPDLEKVLIQKCGHWTQQEKPEELTAVIADWMRRRFLS